MTRSEFLEFRTQQLAAMKDAAGKADAAAFDAAKQKLEAAEKDYESREADAARREEIRRLEEKTYAPAGRVTAPAQGDADARNPMTRRASKEYGEAFRAWVRNPMSVDPVRAGLAIDVDSSGGYVLAPSEIDNEIIKPVKNVAAVASKAKYTMIDGKLGAVGVNLTNVSANSQRGVVVDLTTESTTGESFTFSARRMKSHAFTHWMKVPNSFLDFNMMGDPMSWILQELRERKEVADDYRFLYGDGVEQPLGLLVADTDGIPTSRDVTVCTAGVITYSKMLDAYYTLKPQHRAVAEWMIDTTGAKQLHQLVDSQGRPLPGIDLSTGAIKSLFGRPLTESNNIAATLSGGVYASSQYPGIFGNFQRYQIIESKGVAVKLDPYRLSDEDVTIVYIRSWQDAMPVQAEAFVRLKSS